MAVRPSKEAAKSELATLVDQVFSFDTTGSMAPCIEQVKAKVIQMVDKLFCDIPEIRIGIIAHGDYCDGDQCMNVVDLTNNKGKIIDFIRRCFATGGGDEPECYEYALRKARQMSWRPGSNRSVVIIGDEIPHEPGYRLNKDHIDWKEELRLLNEMKVHCTGVQCLSKGHASWFYDAIKTRTSGFHLYLDNWGESVQTLQAVAYQNAGPRALERYATELKTSGLLTSSMVETMSTLAGSTVKIGEERVYLGKTDKASMRPVNDEFTKVTMHRDMPIKEAVETLGLTFTPGKGFYQLTKAVTVQPYKEVVIESKATGELFTGSKARQILNLPKTTVKLSPTDLGAWNAYIQSTSTNRKLLAGTNFLYRVK